VDYLEHQFDADWPVVASMKSRIAIVLSALLLLGLGCDSNSGGGQKLSVSPSTETLNAGGAAVGFTATLTGSSSVIGWTLSGPGTISTTTGATTSYTPPASVTVATSTTLTATAGSASGNATITTNPAGTVSLEVNPKALVVTAGGAASNLTANLTGSSSAISWTLSGPGTISATTGATTSYTPPASVTAATAATLTATSGNASGRAMITINPSPGPIITVAGQVLDLGGMPVANAPVAIGTQKTTTDASGHFTIAGVTTPYDLVTVTVWNGGQLGIELRGLTRTDPTIAFATAAVAPFVNQARVSGNLSGGDPLSKSGDYTYVAFGSPMTSPAVSVGNNPFDVFLEWSGATSVTANLHALQFAANAFLQPPTSYKGYGTKTGVTVTHGATQSGQDLALASVSTANISGNITLPSAAYSLGSRYLTLAFGDGASIPLLGAVDSALAFNYLMPSGIGATGNLIVYASVIGAQTVVSASGLAPDTSGVSLEVHAAALQVLPADSSTGVTTDTDFTWTAFDGGLHFVYFYPDSQDFDALPAYLVVTSGTTTKIPDLAAFGIGPGLPTGAQYSWFVTAQAPSTIDALTSGSTSPADRTYFSDADGRSFDTQ
jgi:hypothetical protein